MFSRIITIVALTLSLAVLSGCASVSQVLAPGPKVVTQEAVVARPDAEVAGELEDGLPDGVPLWPGAEVVTSRAAAGAYNLTLRATEPYDEVLAGMVAGFTDAGWTVEQADAGETGTRTSVLAVSGPTTEGIVTVSEATDGVRMAYVLSAAVTAE